MEVRLMSFIFKGKWYELYVREVNCGCCTVKKVNPVTFGELTKKMGF